jgi:hypothetical protein
MTKQCTVCNQDKDIYLGYYGKNHLRCIECCKAKGKASYLSLTADQRKDRNSKWGVDQRRLNRYGMTKTQYDELLQLQGKRCAICTRDRKLYIDHDHSSGRVRGLLCRDCNLSLGLVRDNIETLANAIDYLECPPFNEPKVTPKTNPTSALKSS